MPTTLRTQLEKDILSLIAISHLPEAEKELWFEVLPYLTEKEKHELRQNMEDQVRFERAQKEETVKKFIGALET